MCIGGVSAVHACSPTRQDFDTALQHVQKLLGDSTATVLGADFIEDPESDCAAIWVVEVLTPVDDVEILAIDAQTLEALEDLPDYFLALMPRPSFEPSSPDLRPLRIHVRGTPGRDLLEGEWSDDTSFGGPARDMFLLTPGRDVIADFNPNEDVLNMTNFVVVDYGFATLDTFSDVADAARGVQREGKIGTEIDLDGRAGDWSVFLIDVSVDALSPSNVLFPEAGEPSFPPVWQAEREVEVSDGSTVIIPGHPLLADRVDPYLAEGSPEALALIRRLFFFDEFQPDGD